MEDYIWNDVITNGAVYVGNDMSVLYWGAKNKERI
jgi:hypothetical protein